MVACATVFFEHAGVKGNGNMGSGFSRRLLAPLLSPEPPTYHTRLPL